MKANKRRAKAARREKQASARPKQAEKLTVRAKGTAQVAALVKPEPVAVVLPKAAAMVAFTELEEAFFEAGHAMSEGTVEPSEPVVVESRTSWWRRLLSREVAITA